MRGDHSTHGDATQEHCKSNHAREEGSRLLRVAAVFPRHFSWTLLSDHPNGTITDVYENRLEYQFEPC